MKILFRKILFAERKKRIFFDERLLNKMKPYLQLKDWHRECGGILLGYVCKENLDLCVTEMTVPYKGDCSKWNGFIRQSPEHVKMYNRIYESSNKTCLYVGEWHTHPENIPNYSKADEDNWKSISQADKAFPTQIHVIAGRVAVRFWAVCEGEKPILLDTLNWKEHIA